jgi:UDP-glucose 4-epimerase
LGWRPRFDFRYVLERLQREENVFSTLARAVGSKGYYPRSFENGPYPIEGTG